MNAICNIGFVYLWRKQCLNSVYSDSKPIKMTCKSCKAYKNLSSFFMLWRSPNFLPKQEATLKNWGLSSEPQMLFIFLSEFSGLSLCLQ